MNNTVHFDPHTWWRVTKWTNAPQRLSVTRETKKRLFLYNGMVISKKCAQHECFQDFELAQLKLAERNKI